MSQLVSLAVALAAVVLVGCAARDDLALELGRSATQAHLPKVVACWERAFEAAGFDGSYDAVVDFTVRAGSGDIDDTRVVSLIIPDADGAAGTPADDPDMTRCLTEALEASSLGPGGMRPSVTVFVRGFRFTFSDAGTGQRDAASERATRVLIGPRADRCQGLYDHDPPREAAELLEALAAVQTEASETERDLDRHARALQQAYDVALELEKRLALELASGDLPAEGKARIEKELQRTAETSRKLGARIGCKPP